MSAAAQPSCDSEPKNSDYCRKDKSLGVLCSNFVKLYNRDDVDSIGLDKAASQLGVERRRIYDIVNILESLGVLAKKGKNQYSWKGFSAIPRALAQLKEEAIKENFNASCCSISTNVSNDGEHQGPSNSKYHRQSKHSMSDKVDNRREKSLGLLTKSFIKLFLCSDVDTIISLDGAALLLGGVNDPTTMRTAKVRRLYDIANVFSSMDLVEKVRHPESGKSAFKWVGVKGDSTSDSNMPKKRVFGADISNTSLKRCKSNAKENIQMHSKDDCNNNCFVFGPFTPASVAKNMDSGNENIARFQDCESLASAYRPRYIMKASSDAFYHYLEAWKSWNVEAVEKKKIK